MAISWSEDLALGVTEIDEQHKELFARVDRLLEACKGGKGKSEVASLIVFLHEYAVVHFHAEEELQRVHGYPSATPHRTAHMKFARELRALTDDLEDEPGVSFVLRVNRMVVDWLRHHVTGSDKDFAQFLSTKRDRPASAVAAAGPASVRKSTRSGG